MFCRKYGNKQKHSHVDRHAWKHDNKGLKIAKGVEVMTLVVDTSKHMFKKEPFAKSIEAFGEAENDALLGPLSKGVSRRAILSNLGVAKDIIVNEDKEREVLTASKKKKATYIMKKKDTSEAASGSTSQGGPRAVQRKKNLTDASTGGAAEAAQNVIPL